MQAEVKGFLSPDISFETYWPEDISKIFFLMEVMIRLKGEKEADRFQIEVGTLEGFMDFYKGQSQF